MSPLPLLYLTFVIIILSIVLHQTRKRAAVATYNSKQKPNPIHLPPCPPTLPIIGNLHQLGLLPHRSLHALSDQLGPLMLLRLGRVPTLIVSSPDAAREILKDHGVIFASRPWFKVAQTVLYGGKDMAFTPYGEYWRNARKLCVTHLLSSRMVQSFRRIREEQVALLVDKISSSAGSVVDMSEALNSFSNAILCRVVAGESVSQERSKTIRELVAETSTLIGAFLVGDYIPYTGWVDAILGFNARMRRNYRGWDGVLDEMMKSHANGRKGDLGGVDFVDVLLSLQKDSDLGFDLTDENIKALLVDIFAAGTDPPYVVLEWAMSELVRNHKAMKMLQDEVRGIVNINGKIREEDLSGMSYLKGVIKEVLRLHPPSPLLVPRESMKDSQIQGYNIPNKTRVIINAWAISRDPKLWEAPEEFRPERFLGSPIDFKGNDFQFIPFGAGRRICPGMNFAMIIAELALANLVSQFEWELPDGTTKENLDMNETPGLTTRKKQRLELIAKPCSYEK